MKWISNLLSSLQGASTRLPFLKNFGSSAAVAIEQGLEGFLAFMFFALIQRYVPYSYIVTPVAIVILAGLARWRLWQGYKVGACTFIGLSVFFYFLSQPMALIILSGLIAVVAAGLAAYYTQKRWYVRVAAALLALVLAPVVAASVYLVLWLLVLPAVHPLTIWTWNIAPLLSNISTLAILAYCTLRQRDGQHPKYWLATPVLSALFCVCFWPSHSYIGMGASVLTAVALSVYAFINRPTDNGPGRPERSFAAATVAAVAFSGLFLLSNGWQWLYNYQMASAISISEIDASARCQSWQPATTAARATRSR
jgi:phage shock protein PspC (stress-responsive transcriptional regulator)